MNDMPRRTLLPPEDAPPDAERAEQGNVANLDLEFLKDQPQRIEFMPRTGPVLPVKGPAR